jgi:hypothetical protein
VDFLLENFTWVLIGVALVGALAGIVVAVRRYPATTGRGVRDWLGMSVSSAGTALGFAFAAVVVVASVAGVVGGVLVALGYFHDDSFSDLHPGETAHNVRNAMGNPDYEGVRPSKTPVWVWHEGNHVYYVFFNPEPHLNPTRLQSTTKYSCGDDLPELRDARGDTPLEPPC